MFDFLKKKKNTNTTTMGKWFYDGITDLKYDGDSITIQTRFYHKLLKKHQEYNETSLKNCTNDKLVIQTNKIFIDGIKTVNKSSNPEYINLSKNFFDYLIDTYNRLISLNISINKMNELTKNWFDLIKAKAELEAEELYDW